jgi:hypothetical protein
VIATASLGELLAALEDMLLRVSRLSDDLPQIAELELSPVLAWPDGACATGAGRPSSELPPAWSPGVRCTVTLPVCTAVKMVDFGDASALGPSVGLSMMPRCASRGGSVTR